MLSKQEAAEEGDEAEVSVDSDLGVAVWSRHLLLLLLGLRRIEFVWAAFLVN